MFFRIGFSLLTIFVASLVLVTSIVNVTGVKYSFDSKPTPIAVFSEITINYSLPRIGSITPASKLWHLKAIKDRVSLTTTRSSLKGAQLRLFLADERMAHAQNLFEKENYSLGVSVLTKAEKYLEEAVKREKLARSSGVDTSSLLNRLAMATLKHQEVIARLQQMAPDEARPVLVQVNNYPRRLYEEVRTSLYSISLRAPESPFID